MWAAVLDDKGDGEIMSTTQRANMETFVDQELLGHRELAYTSLSPDILEQLSRDPDGLTRCLVGGNDKTSVSVLETLSLDPARIGYGGWNPASPGEFSTPLRDSVTLPNFAVDFSQLTSVGKYSWNIQATVGCNPHTPIPILNRLAYSENKDVREAVINNAHTPRPLLMQLAEHPSESTGVSAMVTLFSQDDLSDSLITQLFLCAGAQ
jgi:hypothetical protein